MSFEAKTPSCKGQLSKESFNRLIALIAKADNIEDKELREKLLEIKGKLLKYSNPKDDNVDYGLYPSQVGDVIRILVENAVPMTINEDYYGILVRNKKKYEEWKNERKGE